MSEDDIFSQDQHYAMDLVAGSQRLETNERLKNIERLLNEQQQQQNFVDNCPYCDGELSKAGVELCKHCGSRLVWVNRFAAKEGEIEVAEERYEAAKRAVLEEFKLKEEQRKFEEAKRQQQIEENEKFRSDMLLFLPRIAVGIGVIVVLFTLISAALKDESKSDDTEEEYRVNSTGGEPLWKRKWEERQRNMADTPDNAAPPSESP